MDKLLREILDDLENGRVEDVRIGLHWTGVSINVNGELRCGLASTVSASYDHGTGFDVPNAGSLTGMSGLEMAQMVFDEHPVRVGLGLAAVNALLKPCQSLWEEINAEHVIARIGENENVGLVGRFPFIFRLREKVKNLYVFEQNPQPGEYSQAQMKDILPDCKVVAITGMTMINHTFEEILSHKSNSAVCLLMGPTTPITPRLFDFGVDLVSGAVVENIEAVMLHISQGAAFRQIHKAGTRLVTIQSPRLKA